MILQGSLFATLLSDLKQCELHSLRLLAISYYTPACNGRRVMITRVNFEPLLGIRSYAVQSLLLSSFLLSSFLSSLLFSSFFLDSCLRSSL